jgi:hypothetical protein
VKRNVSAPTLWKLLQVSLVGLTSLMLCITLSAETQDGCSDQATGHPAFKWTGTEPVVLLTEYNPWAMAIGSDTPTFALYEDGTVIYWQGDRRSGRYVTAKLTQTQVSRLLEATHLDRAVAWIGGFMLFRIDKGISRDFLKENCPPWPYLRQFDSHTGVRFSLLIERDCIGAATNFFAVSSSFHVIVDPPDTTIDGMLVHSFYRLRFLARCVCHGALSFNILLLNNDTEGG